MAVFFLTACWLWLGVIRTCAVHTCFFFSFLFGRLGRRHAELVEAAVAAAAFALGGTVHTQCSE